MITNKTLGTDFTPLNLTETSKSFLKETGKWAYFLSIVGFVAIGIMIVFSFFAGTILANIPQTGDLQNIPSNIFTVLYLICSAIYLLPVYYLFNFARKIKNGFKNNDIYILEEGFKNLKSHYKFIGIFMIVIMGIYTLVLIPVLISILL